MSRKYVRPKKYKRTPSRRKEITYQPRRSGWKFKDIMVWLLIFVVGSLIVTFLISPNSFDNFKYNVKSLIPEKQNVQEENLINTNTIKDVNLITQPKKEYKEVSLDYWNSCSALELNAQIESISEKVVKEKYCMNLCGLHKLEYGYFECRIDKIYCYCEK